MNNLAVYASPLPFSNKQIAFKAVVGSSVQEIVDLICLPPVREHIGAIVQINGHIIHRKHWSRVKPKEGTIINVRIVPQGGKGKKNPLASILSIAVMIAAPYAGAALAGTMGVTSAIGLSAITAGVSIVGSLLVNAIAPPPKPSNAGSVNDPAESPTQFIEGASNSINPFGVVPICLGTNRMFPLQAAKPYTESQDNDQYVRQLFTYGYGDNLLISDLKIGETALSEFNNFELEHRLSGDLYQSTNLFSDDVFQNDYSVLLQEADGFTLRTTQEDIDEAIIDVSFPRGLAQFNGQGKRVSYRVQLEIQYSLAGVNDWSPGVASYKSFAGSSIIVSPASMTLAPPNPDYIYVGYRRDIVVIDSYSGVISIVKGTGIGTSPAYNSGENANYTMEQATPPAVPYNKIRLATVLVRTTLNTSTITEIISVTDDRQASLYPTTFSSEGDFYVSHTGTTLNILNGAIKSNPLDITASQTEALRRSVRLIFPENGQYDIRIRRVSVDTDSDQIFDKAYLSAIKSITHTAPVRLEGICGTALRIQATDQLNGAIDQFNAIVSNVIPNYDNENDVWAPKATSNPAAIYRYVLQGLANDKPLPDTKIDLGALEDWHVYCEQKGYTYNRVIDYETSVDEILRDVAAAGSASPAIVDGKRTVAVDMPKNDVIQVITPRNSSSYSGEIVYPDMPHAFRVQFRNAEKGYQQDERIVYDDGYSKDNATKFENLELQSCTNADLAYKIGRRHLATARLRPETHSFVLDVENLVALRGDRIKLEHDVPIIGIGDGRIKEVYDDGVNVTGIKIDDKITIPSMSSYYVRIRLSDGTHLYKEINSVVGENNTFNFATPFSLEETPEAGDLVYIVEAGGELDLIITRIEPQNDLAARVTAIDYAPAIFNAETGTIPAFESKITTPLEFIRPLAPVLLGAQSDEAAMLRNSDGSFTPRAILTLRNDNDGSVAVQVKVRRSGTDVFTNANILEATPERLILTGMNDGARYDIFVWYRKAGSLVLSPPLRMNSFLFVGASGTPDDVTGFLITVTGETALLKWDANDDIDFSHYRLKFTNAFSGAAWGTAQILEDSVYENRITIPFQSGTYLIKAVDLSGNESESPAIIITYDQGQIKNAVEIVTESPSFHGLKDNIVIDGNGIVLQDTDLIDGYYYFDNDIDLTGLFTSFVSATISANGAFANNVFEIDNLFAEDDIFGSGSNNLFDVDDIFAVDDVFGIGVNAWGVSLEYRTTIDDPIANNWFDWQEFTAGNIEFWSIQFRIKLTSLAQDISPKITQLSVTVDMPDRIERGEDMIVSDTGATVTYDPPFKSNPSVVITLQNAGADDKIIFVSKTSGGFTFKVYNTTIGSYVERIYDFIASGYGRENT